MYTHSPDSIFIIIIIIIYSYICDDWVLNDILTEDIKLLQSLLHQVADQNYIESTTRSGHVIRPSASVFRRMESRCC